MLSNGLDQYSQDGRNDPEWGVSIYCPMVDYDVLYGR